MRYIVLVIVAIVYLTYVSSDSCIQCDSSRDVKCAISPEQFFAKECSNRTSKCFTRVTREGHTIRGCASDLSNQTLQHCHNEMECLVCSFMEGCNRQIFPMHRAQCLQCEGNSTGSCAMNTFAKPVICPLYKLGDRCYIRSTGKNNTHSFQRGCLSTAQANKLCRLDSNCFTCEGVGCNFLEPNSQQIPMARDSAMNIIGSGVVVLLSLIAATMTSALN